MLTFLYQLFCNHVFVRTSGFSTKKYKFGFIVNRNEINYRCLKCKKEKTEIVECARINP